MYSRLHPGLMELRRNYLPSAGVTGFHDCQRSDPEPWPCWTSAAPPELNYQAEVAAAFLFLKKGGG